MFMDVFLTSPCRLPCFLSPIPRPPALTRTVPYLLTLFTHTGQVVDGEEIARLPTMQTDFRVK